MTDLAKGMTVLWKDIKKGPRGRESTVPEWLAVMLAAVGQVGQTINDP